LFATGAPAPVIQSASAFQVPAAGPATTIRVAAAPRTPSGAAVAGGSSAGGRQNGQASPEFPSEGGGTGEASASPAVEAQADSTTP
jgi:hypothetical protein